MEQDEVSTSDDGLETQSILLASSQHDLALLRTLLRKGSANVQDLETGFTPLHATIAACESSSSSYLNGIQTNGASVNGHSKNGQEDEIGDANDADVEAAAKTMRLLLQNGAIWNDLDMKDETPGCMANRLGLKPLYEIMVDAGVRAEMLLNRLDEYEQLRNRDDDKDADEDEGDVAGSEELARDDRGPTSEALEFDPANEIQPNAPSNSSTTETTNPDYILSSLTFQPTRILDSAHNGVMMSWETPIMDRTAALLCPHPGLRILNIGHGMGIIDTFFQSKNPSTHHIIEAHPSVLEHMKASGWHERPNVVVHAGTWQSVIPQIIEQGLLFDAIYFDTFAEDYKALRDFFSDSLIGILDDGGKWGFFNGLGADRQVCYDVYCKLVEMDMFEAGFDTTWETLKVGKMEDGEWEGVKRRYWALEEYKLPVCEYVT